MDIIQKAHGLSNQEIIFSKALYQVLSEYDYSDGKFKTDSLGDVCI